MWMLFINLYIHKMLSSALFNNTTFPKSKQKRINLPANAGLVLFPTENPRLYHCKNIKGKSRPQVGDFVRLNTAPVRYRIVHVEERVIGPFASKNCVLITVANAAP